MCSFDQGCQQRDETLLQVRSRRADPISLGRLQQIAAIEFDGPLVLLWVVRAFFELVEIELDTSCGIPTNDLLVAHQPSRSIVTPRQERRREEVEMLPEPGARSRLDDVGPQAECDAVPRWVLVPMQQYEAQQSHSLTRGTDLERLPSIEDGRRSEQVDPKIVPRHEAPCLRFVGRRSSRFVPRNAFGTLQERPASHARLVRPFLGRVGSTRDVRTQSFEGIDLDATRAG